MEGISGTPGLMKYDPYANATGEIRLLIRDDLVANTAPLRETGLRNRRRKGPRIGIQAETWVSVAMTLYLGLIVLAFSCLVFWVLSQFSPLSCIGHPHCL